MPNIDLSIIIVNWNSKAYLRECLKSVRQHSSDLSLEILVIDNASRDGAGQMLAEQFSEVTYIQGEENLGFSRANNMAARRARADLILFLNPDTVVEDGSLAELVRLLHSLPGAGAVGAKLLNTDRTVQTSCIMRFPSIVGQAFDSDALRRRFPRAALWGMAPLHISSVEPSDVEVISGACLMVRREVFERLRGFDERYFMYSEDTDLCYRIHEAGYKCYYVPTATVMHHGGGSSQSARSAFSNVMLRESTYRFLRIHRGELFAVCFRLSVLLTAFVRMLLISLLWAFRKSKARSAAVGIKKWISILRWSVGAERWAAKQ